MKIAFLSFARLGDVICGIPAYLALREKYPKGELTWVTMAQYEAIVPKCGLVRVHGNPPYGSIPPWAKQPNYDLVICAQPMWRHREWEQSHTHAVDLICKWSGVAPIRKLIVIDVPQVAYEAVRKKVGIPDKPFATICSSPCYSCVNWQPAMRQQVVDALVKMSIPIVTVGGRDGVALNNTIQGHNKLSIMESLALINLSKLYIGPDTGVTWLACAARNTAKLCILDKNRLRQGMVGFQSVLSDGNIRDLFYQDGVQRHVQVAGQLWNQ